MLKTKRSGWYQRKTFPHFEPPIDFGDAKKLVESPSAVASHSFLPFIGFIDRKRRFKPKTLKKYENKERDLKYCSHRDGYVFSFYAYVLSEAYEGTIRGTELADCVIGYRPKLGTNVDFSKEVFDEIRKRKNCSAIALDIKDFFPSISHASLKDAMERLLCTKRLSDDWFAVYRAMTNFSWVNQDELAKALATDARKFKRPICSVQEFRKLRSSVPDFVKTNSSAFGIPQGAPISAIMSNVSMLRFDEKCIEFCVTRNAFYRRYSDDIVIVCDTSDVRLIEQFVDDEIQLLSSAMKVSSDKTECANFIENPGGTLACDKPLSYLGFTFDGERVFLRGKTVSRYYRRMTYAGRSAKRAAKKNGSTQVFRRKLISQFSHLGKLNFYSYARRASETHSDETPKRQLRRHFNILYRLS